MEGKLITKDECKVIGIGMSGPYSMMSQIPELWDHFVDNAEQIKNRVSSETFIAPFHDRATDFTYYVTVEVENDHFVPDGMINLTIPTQQYAVFTHKGPNDQVQSTYMKAFGWLKNNGFEKDVKALSLEVYNELHEPDSPEFGFDIYIPIK